MYPDSMANAQICGKQWTFPENFLTEDIFTEQENFKKQQIDQNMKIVPKEKVDFQF